MVYIGIDQSLRSSGIVALQNDKVIDYKVVKTFASLGKKKAKAYPELCKLILDNEELLEYITNDLLNFIKKYPKENTKVNIEGLALRAKSNSLDKLFTLHWYLRLRLKKLGYQYIVTESEKWRTQIFGPGDRAMYKDIFSEYPLKWAAVIQMPKDIQKEFNDYIEKNILTFENEESVFDISEAYWIAKYLFKK